MISGRQNPRQSAWLVAAALIVCCLGEGEGRAAESVAAGESVGSAEAGDDPIVAWYTSGTVTASEYHSWLAVTGAADDPDKRLHVVTSIAAQESLAAAAQERGAADRPAIRVQLADLENAMLEAALFRRQAADIEIVDEEVAAWIAANGSRMDRPRRVRLSNIFKRVGPDSGSLAQQRQELKAVRERLVAGADWAEMAMLVSDSQTRFRRGSIGLVKPGMLEAAVERVAFALAPGQISDVIESEGGLTLLRCDGVEEAKSRSPAEKREQALEALRREKVRERKLALGRDLLTAVRLDLAAARGPATPAGSVVAESPGSWRLSLREAELMLRARGLRARFAELPEQRAQQLLEELAVRLQAARRARELGLDRDGDMAATLHWRRVLVLAAEELKHRLQSRFVPIQKEDIRAHFDQHQTSYRIPEKYQLAAISFRAERADLEQRYGAVSCSSGTWGNRRR